MNKRDRLYRFAHLLDHTISIRKSPESIYLSSLKTVREQIVRIADDLEDTPDVAMMYSLLGKTNHD